MSYAVIQIAGKQYKVSEGETIVVNKLDVNQGETITITDVLLVGNDKDVTIGTPIVAKAEVKAEVIAQGKGAKIRVFKYKSKSRYRRTIGHRQQESTLKIVKIKA